MLKVHAASSIDCISNCFTLYTSREYIVYTGQKHYKYKNKMMTSFLPSTCLSLLENMDERLLDIEYTRVTHLDNISTKTRSKPTNANKKDFLRSLLLQSEPDVNQAHQSLEVTIFDALKSIISRERTTCKDVATSTRDDASSPKILIWKNTLAL